jgi:Zn-dependent peptidase ImmA (M78 family)
VAAEFLVPRVQFLLEPLIQNVGVNDWEDWRLQELARSYGVSAEVILRRLLTFGRTTESFYGTKRDEWQAARQAAVQESSGFIEYFRRVLRDNGAAFTSLVLDAYHSDLVTPTEVSRFLGGVKLKHLPAIEDALEGAGA